MSCPTMAQLLSNTLYFKRFFPYYAFNVLGGLDEEGKGCVFTYDDVGSNERVGYGAQGSGSTLIMPFLDNQLKSPSPLLLPEQGPNVNTSPSNCTLMCLDSLRKQELKSKGFEESLALAVSMNDTFGSDLCSYLYDEYVYTEVLTLTMGKNDKTKGSMVQRLRQVSFHSFLKAGE